MNNIEMMKKIVFKILFSGIFIFFLPLYSSPFLSVEINAKVVINEVLPNPNEGEDEWVELYNTGTEVAPLTNCILYLDATYDPQKIEFNDDDFVDKFEVISLNASWLNNDGDLVKLKCLSYEDSVAYGNASGAEVPKPGKGITFGRYPDGTGNFFILVSDTMNDYNSPYPSPTPTPTNTPIPPPTSTNTPTNTPTQTPAPTSSPTNTPKPTVTPKPTTTPKDYTKQNEEIQNDATDVSIFRLSEDLQSEDTGVLGASEDADLGSENISPFAYVLLVLGLIFIIISATIFIKNKKKGNSTGSV